MRVHIKQDITKENLQMLYQYGFNLDSTYDVISTSENGSGNKYYHFDISSYLGFGTMLFEIIPDRKERIKNLNL